MAWCPACNQDVVPLQHLSCAPRALTKTEKEAVAAKRRPVGAWSFWTGRTKDGEWTMAGKKRSSTRPRSELFTPEREALCETNRVPYSTWFNRVKNLGWGPDTACNPPRTVASMAGKRRTVKDRQWTEKQEAMCLRNGIDYHLWHWRVTARGIHGDEACGPKKRKVRAL